MSFVVAQKLQSPAIKVCIQTLHTVTYENHAISQLLVRI